MLEEVEKVYQRRRPKRIAITRNEGRIIASVVVDDVDLLVYRCCMGVEEELEGREASAWTGEEEEMDLSKKKARKTMNRAPIA